VADEIADQLDRTPTGSTFSTASIGCGSAREVEQALRKCAPVHCNASFTLIDQDPEALEWAREHLRASSAIRDTSRVELRFVEQLLGALLRQPGLLQRWAGQSLVYCIGLLDYMADETLPGIAAALMSILRPGGTLLLGNMKHPTSTFWPLEFILDWYLHYRTKEEMLALAEMAEVDSSELLLDATGNNYILKLCKRQ
jgi:extracellular factor (EF) 3-hydroxypalmitic acid methyl ester biosynthesis protein